jgi:hypothetical protein
MPEPLSSLPPPVADELAFAPYQARQLRETMPEQLAHRAARLHPSGKFVYENGGWRGLSYEGAAVVSMLSTNPGNDALAASLVAVQQQLAASFADPATCFLLPPASFHQTVANTLSDDRYREQVVRPGLVAAYPGLVGRAMAGVPVVTRPEPIRMRLAGLSLFSGAIGILGVFDEPTDYERILTFRRAFYADSDLAALTVRRTRPFIGHITLAYLETTVPDAEKARLTETCVAVNQRLTADPPYFLISTTELRTYPHLADFQTQPGYPGYSFVG